MTDLHEGLDPKLTIIATDETVNHPLQVCSAVCLPDEVPNNTTCDLSSDKEPFEVYKPLPGAPS